MKILFAAAAVFFLNQSIAFAACEGNDKLRLFGILASHPSSALAGDTTIAKQFVSQNGEFIGHVGDYFILEDGKNKFGIHAPNDARVSIEITYVKDQDGCVQRGIQTVKPSDKFPCANPKDLPYQLKSWSGYDTVHAPNLAVVVGSLAYRKRPFPDGCLDQHSSGGDIIYDNLILEIASNVQLAEVSVEGTSAGTLNLTQPISIPYPAHMSSISVVLKKDGYANCQILIKELAEKYSTTCDLVPL